MKFPVSFLCNLRKGTTMQANVLRRWFPRFEHLLNESGILFKTF
ncbi:hypothetical protein Hanom_Chr02g00143351 [Helianthus anomalus]